MASFLERYLGREYEGVWDELTALEQTIMDPPLYRDALAVAFETMQRVKRNIEVLIPRLVQDGFHFGYDWLISSVLEAHPLDFHVQRDYYELFQWRTSQPPVYLSSTFLEAQIAELAGYKSQDSGEEMQRYWQEQIDELVTTSPLRWIAHNLELIKDQIPLSIYAWYKIIGGVNLVGFHPGWEHILNAQRMFHGDLDPLVIQPLLTEKQSVTDLLEKTHHLVLSLDVGFKMHRSGGGPYYIQIPNRAADATVLGYEQEIYFIPYLRNCLKYAGFPGLATLDIPPDISHLVDLLIPF